LAFAGVVHVATPVWGQQSGTLVGTVRSEAGGLPIGGAMVALDMGRSTLADDDGTFRLDDVPPGPYRIAAVAPGCHVGVGTVEMAAGQKLQIDVVVPLPDDAEARLATWALGERSSGSAVRSMTGEEIRRRNLRSVADALRILAPDMVGQESAEPGGRQSLRPRGAPTVAGPRDVLVVVDGIRVAQSAVDALASMNPGDIQRIDVTRGAAGGWVYGMQGANGVIIITTRNAPAEHPRDTRPEECGFVFPR